MTPGPYKLPTSLEEHHQLQRDTTSLVNDEQLKAAVNKLCPGMTQEQRSFAVGQFASDAEIIEAAGTVSDATKQRYLTRGASVMGDAQSTGQDAWDLVAQKSGNVCSWYTFKAQLRFYLLDRLPFAKREVDRLLRRQAAWTDDDREAFHLSMHHLVLFANALATTPLRPPEKFSGNGKTKRPVRSKAASIKGKPQDWQVKHAGQFEGDDQLLYLLSAVTGCRPVELERGVTVVKRTSGDLEISIVGAKRSKHAGQALRSMTFDSTSGVAKKLADLLTVDVVVRSEPLIGKVNTFSKRVARKGLKAFPADKASERVTLYSNRNQFTTNLRAARLSPEEIAKAMGHSTTKSAAYYGSRPKSGASAVTPRNIKASRPVKVRDKHPGTASSTQKSSRARSTPTAVALGQNSRARKAKP